LQLAAVVLMAGSVRQTDLGRTAQRALLDLPVLQGRTVGDCWLERVRELREARKQPDLPLIVAANGIAGSPRDTGSWPCTRVFMDSEAARGSGGALHDAVKGLPRDHSILVIPGHSYPREGLSPLLDVLSRIGSDVMIHADLASVPSGVFLLRCSALANVSPNGFADLKEQVLPQLPAGMDARVVRTDHAMPIAIRSLEGYIKALRAAAGRDAAEAPLEEWRCTFTLAEPGSEVHPTARLHDSIVLAGGRVGADALVVRSLVGPGGTVAAGDAVFDRFVSGEKQ
jgi:hypothetical protein